MWAGAIAFDEVTVGGISRSAMEDELPAAFGLASSRDDPPRAYLKEYSRHES